MTQTRQPGNIWDRKYPDFSRAQHERSKALAKRLVSEPIVLSTLESTLETELRQMVRDADKMAETRYTELAAERDTLEVRLGEATALLAERDKELGPVRTSLEGELKGLKTEVATLKGKVK